MAGPKGASLPWARGRWSCGRRGSTIAGAMSTASASALAAASCRPTCGVRPRWPRCCPSCTCAGSLPAISAPRSRGCWRGRSWVVADQHHTVYHLRERIHGVSPATSRAASTFTCGSMGCISTSGSKTTGSAPLVMIGARPNGEKELLAVEDGYRESAESWKTLLRELKRRGLAAPVVAVGDGALGFWAATREVWPETREQACWCHKLANVLDKLPQRLQPRAKRALHEMMYAACRTDCAAARSRFEAEYQAKYPRAVESLTANWERLVTFFDFPAEHWKHLRTTNVIESPFATVRLRERATKGAGSRTKGLLMAFKLLDMAQLRWRRLDGAQLLPLVRAGVKFADGVRVDPAKLVTQSTDNQPRKAA